MKKITPLTLDRAVQLYDKIGKYLPQIDNANVDVIEYSKSLLKNVGNGDTPNDFFWMLAFMSEYTPMEIMVMSVGDRLELIVTCVTINQLWLLKAFMEHLNYGNAK